VSGGAAGAELLPTGRSNLRNRFGRNSLTKCYSQVCKNGFCSSSADKLKPRLPLPVV
jgi:hypothetical protein